MRLFLRRASILDILNMSFLAVVLAFFLVVAGKTPHRMELVSIFSLLILLLFSMGWVREAVDGGRWKRVGMFAYPVVFLFVIFESFYMILPYFNPYRFDDLMVRIDHGLLGTHPTLWLERWVAPWWTEALYILYFFYFPMPLIVLGWMLGRGMIREIEESFFLFLVCYYGAYIVYFFVPVTGPRFHLHGMHTVPLDGYLLSEPIRKFIDFLEPNKLDCFPSLHAAILAVTMVVAYRYNRRMFLAFLPVAFGITVSLVYLRYHYVVDVIAGFGWAWASIRIAGTVYRRYGNRFPFHFQGAGS